MNRLRAMTIGGALLVELVLAVFAYVILDSQRQNREDVEQRFRDVADVAAALTDGIFQVSLGGNQQTAQRRLSDRRLRPSTLDELADERRLAYVEVRNAEGRRLVASAKAPPATRTSSAVELAVERGESRFSEVLPYGDAAVIESAVRYDTPHGSRVYVAATPAEVFADFLRGFLGRIPNFAGAESVMIDDSGVVIGGTRLSTPVGQMLRDTELLDAALAKNAGDYHDGRYFASVPIAGSPFHVVLDARKDDIHDSISGSAAIPWILFAAFGFAALVGLFLLRRAASVSAELGQRELNERHAVEINDNIIQGLALAKYQLQLGQGEASAEQLAQTLREAQRLVSGLLGSAEVQAGQLRREVAADTGPEAGQQPEQPKREDAAE